MDEMAKVHIRTSLQILALLSLVGGACGGGGGSPTQSTPVVVPWNQPGHVVATNTQTPVAGAHVSTPVASADTNGNGDFTLTAASTPSASQAVTVTASGYLTHETSMRLPRTTPLNLDLISTAPPFDQTFYDAMARGAMNGNSYALSRWDHQMTFFLKTVDENGRPLTDDELNTIRRGINTGVPIFTNNTYAAKIEEGTDTREGKSGYITILPKRVIQDGDYCSEISTVGADPAVIDLRLEACGCNGISIPIIEVLHAVGNAVGLFSVAEAGHVMSNPYAGGCAEVLPTAKEQYHAALIYSRPRGNTMPDKDPITFTLSASAHTGGGPERATRRR
jgi:hypothetical protein